MLYLAWNSNSCTRPGHRGRKHKHHPTCKPQELEQPKEHIINCEPGLTVSSASSNTSTNLQPQQNPLMSIHSDGKLWRLDRSLNLHWCKGHDMNFGLWSFAWIPVAPSNLAHSSWFCFQATCQSPPVRQRTTECSFNRDKKLKQKTNPVWCCFNISSPIRSWIPHCHASILGVVKGQGNSCRSIGCTHLPVQGLCTMMSSSNGNTISIQHTGYVLGRRAVIESELWKSVSETGSSSNSWG